MSVTGTVKKGVVILPAGTHIPDGTTVKVEPIEPVEEDAFVKAVRKVAKPRPHWPRDYSLNHGHYVSAEPKKP